MLDAAVAAIGGPSTDAASTVGDVEAAETAAAVAVATTVPTSCDACVGQSSGCGGRGCHVTAAATGPAAVRPALALGDNPTALADTAFATGWSSVHYPRVCLR